MWDEEIEAPDPDDQLAPGIIFVAVVLLLCLGWVILAALAR